LFWSSALEHFGNQDKMSKALQSVNEFLDPNAMECLNQDATHTIASAFVPGSDRFLSSDPDVDQQLLIKVQFRQPVKISAIRITAVDAGEESAPASIKIFQNKNHIGFGEAEDEEPTASLTFSSEEVNGQVEKQVPFVRFQNVTSLQLFVGENHGADVTKIAYIDFLGQPAEKSDMKEFKPVKG